jgi:broad specificity phosphatase PhoE
VVAHGGPVRVMVCGLLELPMSVYPRLRVENTAVSRILFTGRGAILAAFNDVSHLRNLTSQAHCVEERVRQGEVEIAGDSGDE